MTITKERRSTQTVIFSLRVRKGANLDEHHVLKSDYLRKKLRITQEVFFPNELKNWQTLKKGFDMMETIFGGSNLLNGTNTTGKSFAPQNVPHIVQLIFSGVLMHFRRKLIKKTSL